MDLGFSSAETLVFIVGGFLIGLIPALVFVGFYFGRQVEKQRKALQLKYERQVVALRATVRRLMHRIDELTSERNQLKRSNAALRDALKDQHDVTDRASSELEQTRQNLLRLQVRADELHESKLRYEGRLQEVEASQQRLESSFQKTVAQFTEVERLRENLVYAAGRVREYQAENEALTARFASGLDPVAESNLAPDELDISFIAGAAPYADRLHDSGIHTIGDLARQTPARVAHFAGLPSLDDSAAWIAEAKARLASSGRPQG